MSETASSTPVLSVERLASAYSYSAYRQLLDGLMAQNRTTGATQTDELVQYTHLNIQRMQRIDKTVELLPELRTALAALPAHYVWLVLTEGWCGDAAQVLPVLEAVAQASAGRLTTHYLLRDEHLDLMDRYLTNGSRAIPKLIVLHADTLTEVTHWGPRPAPALELAARLKQEGISHDDFLLQLHGWYAKDHTLSTQRELLELLRSLL